VRRLLDRKTELDDLTIRQLEKIRLRAAEAPGTIPEVVTACVKAEAKQAAVQDGYVFSIQRGGQKTTVSANEIDGILVRSRDLSERQSAWEASKAIGQPLRAGLLQLRGLRNRVAQAMGFDSFFALQVADYGMTASERDRHGPAFQRQTQGVYYRAS
jgi:peptidyl-dipeptidase A